MFRGNLVYIDLKPYKTDLNKVKNLNLVNFFIFNNKVQRQKKGYKFVKK